MAVAGRLSIFINADTTHFQRGLKAVEGQARKLSQLRGSLMTAFAVPAAVLTGITALTARAAAAGAAIDDMAHRTGIARSTLQELSYVSGQLGTSIEGVEGVLASFTRRLPQIQSGTGSAAAAFKRLGLSATDASGGLRPMGDLFRDTLAALSEVGNETERNALATQLFGRRALEIAPMIAAGGAELDRLTARAHELGLVMSDQAIASLAEFDDQMAEVKAQTGAVARDFALGIIPAVQAVLPVFQAVATKFREFVGGIQLMAVDMTVFWEGKVPLYGAILRQHFGSAIAFVIDKLASLLDAMSRIPGLGAAAGGAATLRRWANDMRTHFAGGVDHARERLAMFEAGAEAMRAEIVGVGEAAETAAGSGGGGGVKALVDETAALAFWMKQAGDEAQIAGDKLKGVAEFRSREKTDPDDALGATKNGVVEALDKVGERYTALLSTAEEWSGLVVDQFAGLVTGAQTVEESFKNMVGAVIGHLGRLLAKIVAVNIATAILNSLTGGVGGAAKGVDVVGWAGKNLSLTGLANGGFAAAGTPYMVGERGPELFVPRESGTVVPNHALGSGGGVVRIDLAGAPRVMSPREAALQRESIEWFAAMANQHLAVGGSFG